MKFLKSIVLFFLLIGMTHQAEAQFMFESNAPKHDFLTTEFTTILHNGEVLAQNDLPAGPLSIEPGTSGTLTVSTLDKQKLPSTAIGFKVAIKSYRTNSIWMYSDETFYEVDLEDLQKECELGDVIIFITIDSKYRLSRNEVSLNGGC